MNNQKRLKRLKELLNLLENHDVFFPKVKFNLKLWSMGSKKKNCTTAACALGSAACYLPFINLGLKLSDGIDGEPVFIIDGEEFWGMEAGQKFFGITYIESEWLFNPIFYHRNSEDDTMAHNVKPIDVSKRVRAIICHYRKFKNIPFMEFGHDFEKLPLIFKVVGAL